MPLACGACGGLTLWIRADCGWTDACEPATLEALSQVAPRVDAVLLSHGDLAHLGALPAAFARCGLRRGTPVCATTPVAKMGQLALYDLYAARHGEGEFSAFTLDEVDASFAAITALKYTQTLTLRSAGGCGVSVCAFAAGHTLGGSVWRMGCGAEEVVYCSQWNNRQERHLPPLQWGTLTRPSLLIAHAGCARRPAPAARAARERALCDAAASAALSGGLALLPTSCSGRALELALALEAHWVDTPALSGVRLVLLSPVAPSALEFAATQLEWMAETVARRFQSERANPFSPMRFLTPVASLAALDALPQAPMVVLASLPSLGAGPARALLARCAANPRAAVLLTGCGEEAELVRALRDAAPIPQHLRPPLTLQLGRRVALDGEELGAWRERQRAQAEAEAEAEAQAQALQQQAEAEAAEQQAQAQQQEGGETGLTESVAEAFSAALRGFGQPPTLCHGFQPPPGCGSPMFPFAPAASDVSDYGELVSAADFAVLGGGGAGEEGEWGAGPGAGGAGEGARAGLGEGEEAAAPTRLLNTTLTLPMACTLASFDFGGLADGRSVRHTLQQLRARRTVLVGGCEADVAALGAAPAGEWGGDAAQPCAPLQGQRLDLSAATPSFLLALAPELADTQLVAAGSEGTYSVAWLDGVLEAGRGGEGGGAHPAFGLRLCAPPPGQAPQPHAAARVGDARLSDLLAACTAAGIPAQFSAGGVLLAAGGVSVRKAEGDEAQLLLEGCLGDAYYAVKAVIDAQWRCV